MDTIVIGDGDPTDPIDVGPVNLDLTNVIWLAWAWNGQWHPLPWQAKAAREALRRREGRSSR